MIHYDVIILATRKNIPILSVASDYIHKNLGGDKYFCIANESLRKEVETLGFSFIDENKMIEGLSFNSVKTVIQQCGGDGSRTGWYFQQFLKLGYAMVCGQSYYLVWDSDTIPLNPISYENNGKLIFSSKIENHKPYFNTIARLFKGVVQRYDENTSFIAENMIFDVSIVKHMLGEIDDNNSLEGIFFWGKILHAVEPCELNHAGFSEFETYGNYAMKYYGDHYILKNRRTLRIGSFVVGYVPNDDQLRWLSKDFDVVGIEKKARRKRGEMLETWYSYVFCNWMMRRFMTAKKAASLGYKIRNRVNKALGYEEELYENV